MFNEDTDALIGDGTRFESFANPATVDTKTDTKVKSTIPTGPAVKQDFGHTTVDVVDGDETIPDVLAQEYWNDIQSRLNMVKKLKKCLIN